MNTIHFIFLKILKSALQGQSFTEPLNLSSDEWKKLFSLSAQHNVLPLIYQSVYMRSELKIFSEMKTKVRNLIMMQTMKTEEFLRLNSIFSESGLYPLVVKGLICRNLYPNPDLRMSSDEDLLIAEEQFIACTEVLEQFEMYSDTDVDQLPYAYEIPYRKKNGMLYVELHKSLFPPESDAYGDWNRFFEKSMDNSIEINGIRTLCHTDHLFYLICHAFKHFLHSGFGIRQVCDIVMYANTYGSQVNWETVYQNCREIHAEVFAAALFQIGQKYLAFDVMKANYPQYWQQIEVDETDLLHDLLGSGVFGGSTMSRKHSSNITLEAVSSDKQGKKVGISLSKSLFPSAHSLEKRYPYLKKYPFLLPFAWIARIVKYGKEQKGKKDNSAVDTLKIGKERVVLLQKYKIIK